MKLTINILVKNNEETIENTLDSVSGLESDILIGDLGCGDKTINVCKKYKNTNILYLGNIKDRSLAKNKLIKENKTNWVFFIEPWELWISTSETLNKIILPKPESYRVNVLQNDLITKSIRLWHKDKNLKFKNPIFETLNDKQSKHCDIYLSSIKKEEKINELNILENWRESKPLDHEPLYYLAFYYLKQKEWKKFLGYANLYLHQEKVKSMSFIMTNYYCAMVKCYIESEKNLKESISHIVYCLSEKSLMSEFWCLLADIYYSLNDYDKAISFYENALILGSKRLANDEWPIEISKYKEYPEKMINHCLKIKENIKIFTSK
jgi:tetratricopeptide (TPR) repeat protein